MANEMSEGRERCIHFKEGDVVNLKVHQPKVIRRQWALIANDVDHY